MHSSVVIPSSVSIRLLPEHRSFLYAFGFVAHIMVSVVHQCLSLIIIYHYICFFLENNSGLRSMTDCEWST